MKKSEIIRQEHKTYEILAVTEVIPGSEPHPHAGEWETVVTIYMTSNSEPPKAQSFHQFPQYAGTAEEAIKKGLEYGRNLVLGATEGLKF